MVVRRNKSVGYLFYQLDVGSVFLCSKENVLKYYMKIKERKLDSGCKINAVSLDDGWLVNIGSDTPIELIDGEFVEKEAEA